MENFIVYMAKACGLIAVFFLAYHILLKKETFFTSNRWFLLAGLFTSAALPFIVYTKTVWVDAAPLPEYARTITLDQLIRYKEQMAQQQQESVTINWFDVIGGMYLAGVLLFSIRFIIDFLSIRRILSGTTAIKDGRFRLIDSEKAKSPFSFFNYIVYNSALLKPEELASIIVHEKVHSSQKHSLDMILGQLFCIVFWFNPLIWMYKKTISQNLEFIADAGAMKLMEDKKAYQKTLLKITVQPDCIGITNHFYQSLIKKRIVMLNKQRSNNVNSWKYATVLPLLGAFIFLFQIKVVAQEKEPVQLFTDVKVKVAVAINKDTKDEELEESKKLMKEEFDADVAFENVKRNLEKEITSLKVTVKEKGNSQVYEVAGNSPIAPFTIEVEKGKNGRNMIAFGSANSNNFLKGRAFHIADNPMRTNPNDTTQIQKHKIIKSYGTDGSDMIMSVPRPHSAPQMGNWSVNSLKIGGTDMLIVINGTKQKKGESIKLPIGEDISEMNMLTTKDAKKKYGKEGKEGAVEITTRKSNNVMAFAMGPEAFSFDMPQNFNFEFDMPDFELNMEDFKGMGDLNKILEGENIRIFGNMLSEEEMKQIQEDINRARIEVDGIRPMIEEKNRMKEMNKEEMKATKEEIKKAKKEIEEARKDLEKSRKDLEKTRKELNKKA